MQIARRSVGIHAQAGFRATLRRPIDWDFLFRESGRLGQQPLLNCEWLWEEAVTISIMGRHVLRLSSLPADYRRAESYTSCRDEIWGQCRKRLANYCPGKESW